MRPWSTSARMCSAELSPREVLLAGAGRRGLRPLPRPLTPLRGLHPPATSGSAHDTARKERPGVLKVTRCRRKASAPQTNTSDLPEGRGLTGGTGRRGATRGHGAPHTSGAHGPAVAA